MGAASSSHPAAAGDRLDAPPAAGVAAHRYARPEEAAADRPDVRRAEAGAGHPIRRAAGVAAHRYARPEEAAADRPDVRRAEAGAGHPSGPAAGAAAHRGATREAADHRHRVDGRDRRHRAGRPRSAAASRPVRWTAPPLPARPRPGTATTAPATAGRACRPVPARVPAPGRPGRAAPPSPRSIPGNRRTTRRTRRCRRCGIRRSCRRSSNHHLHAVCRVRRLGRRDGGLHRRPQRPSGLLARTVDHDPYPHPRHLVAGQRRVRPLRPRRAAAVVRPRPRRRSATRPGPAARPRYRGCGASPPPGPPLSAATPAGSPRPPPRRPSRPARPGSPPASGAGRGTRPDSPVWPVPGRARRPGRR